MPMRTVVRLRTRLMNQKMLMRMADAAGEFVGNVSIDCGADAVPLSGLSRPVAIRVSRAMIMSFGSG